MLPDRNNIPEVRHRVFREQPRVLIFAFLLLLLFGTGSCSRAKESKVRGDSSDPIPVKTYSAEEQTVSRRVQAVGSLVPLDESVVSAQVEGRIEKVLVDVGDRVSEGQVMVTLDDTELRFELDRQRAIVRQVRAQLGLGPADPLPRDATRVAFVERAAADMFDAEQKYKRAEQLNQDKLISQQQLDEAASRYKGARAAYDLSLQQVDQLKAQLQSSEASANLAEKKLKDASIRAPFSGSIKERRVSPGEYLRVQSPVMVVVRTDQLRARLSVPEKWAGAVKVGSTVDVQMEAYPGETFQGQLVRINPSVAQDSRTFDVEALLSNPGGRLKPGFFIQASMPSDKQEKTLTIPEEAVNYRYGVYRVFVLNGSQVQERQISRGAQQGSRVEVLEGLQVGERVAVAVLGDLRDGAVVRQQSK